VERQDVEAGADVGVRGVEVLEVAEGAGRPLLVVAEPAEDDDGLRVGGARRLGRGLSRSP